MVDFYNGDCLELMRNIPDESVDLVLTDPPYKIVSGGCTNRGNMATTGIMKQNADGVRKGTIFKHNEITFKEWLPVVYSKLKQGTHCYIMVNGRNLAELMAEAKKAGFVYQNLLVWDKGTVTPNKWYMNRCEFILMLRKGKAKNINNKGTSTLIQVPNIVGKKVHQTEKPVELLRILIENSTNPGETVLDPFAGSGSTGVACANTGRNFVGMELDGDYFAIAKERIEAAQPECMCPLGGDETNDCAGCAYSVDYHFENGECVKRRAQ